MPLYRLGLVCLDLYFALCLGLFSMCKVYRGKLHRTVTLISEQAFGQYIDEAFALVPAPIDKGVSVFGTDQKIF